MSYFPFSVRRFCFRCLLFTLDDDYPLPYVLLSVFVVSFLLLVSAVLFQTMTTLCRVPYFPLLVPVGSFVCCVSCFVCRPFSCGNCCLFCGVAVFVPLPFCLYPVFCPLTWGRCLGCGCGFAWFAGGFLGSCFCPVGVCTLAFVPCCWVVLAQVGDGVFVGASGYCAVPWCLFWCVWFVVYMLCVVFGMSAFQFQCVGVLVYMMCTVFSMSAFRRCMSAFQLLCVYIVVYMMCTVFSMSAFFFQYVGVSPLYVGVLAVVCLYCRLYDVYSFQYVGVLAGVCLRFAFGVLVFLFCGVGVFLLVCRLYDVYFFRYVAVLVVVCRRPGYYMFSLQFI